MSNRPNDRIFVSTSYMADSAVVSWAAAADGITSREDLPDYDGELMVLMDGRAVMKWWDGQKGDEYPFVMVIDPARKNGSYVSVYATEDQPPSESDELLWKSDVPATEAGRLNVDTFLELVEKELAFADHSKADPREHRWLLFLGELHKLTNEYIDWQEGQ